jgi:hypothetical protein
VSIAPRAIFGLQPVSKIGPWSGGSHPGLIVATCANVVTLIPLSTSAPRGHEKQYGYEITDGGGALSTPIWAYCHCLVSIDATALPRQSYRGLLPHEQLGPIRDRIAKYLGVPL